MLHHAVNAVVSVAHRPEQAEVFRVAFSALLATRKLSQAAFRRCRRRMARAHDLLSGEAPDWPGGDSRVPHAAAGALMECCKACGKCPGIIGRRLD